MKNLGLAGFAAMMMTLLYSKMVYPLWSYTDEFGVFEWFAVTAFSVVIWLLAVVLNILFWYALVKQLWQFWRTYRAGKESLAMDYAAKQQTATLIALFYKELAGGKFMEAGTTLSLLEEKLEESELKVLNLMFQKVKLSNYEPFLVD